MIVQLIMCRREVIFRGFGGVGKGLIRRFNFISVQGTHELWIVHFVCRLVGYPGHYRRLFGLRQEEVS